VGERNCGKENHAVKKLSLLAYLRRMRRVDARQTM